MSDILYPLKRQSFPHVTRSALDRLQTCFPSASSGNIPGLGSSSEDLAEQIIDEFIFFQSANGKHYKKLSAAQELQLLEIILKYFQNQQTEHVRHMVFKGLFHTNINVFRKDVLCRLVSMAVAVKNVNLLDSAAVWMQMRGCSTEIACEVAHTLIEDYIVLVPGSSGVLRQLPSLSEHFACNFVTAIASMYQPPGGKSVRILSVQLLEIITEWIQSQPQLFLVSVSQAQLNVLQPQRATLWTSPTKPNTQTPIPGLVRWCTRAPLLKAAPHISTKLSEASPDSETWDTMWSKLHLAILHTILSFTGIPGAPQLELITLADMNRVVKEMSGLIKQVKDGIENEHVQTAVNRLMQILQVALATGAFRCSLADLRTICNSIPPNRLLSILEKQHLSSAPPPMHNAT